MYRGQLGAAIEAPWGDALMSIQESKSVSQGGAGPGVARACHAHTLRMADESNPEPFKSRTRPVSRTIVDNDNFVITSRVGPDRFYRAP